MFGDSEPRTTELYQDPPSNILSLTFGISCEFFVLARYIKKFYEFYEITPSKKIRHWLMSYFMNLSA
jgi:hypothetical protein